MFAGGTYRLEGPAGVAYVPARSGNAWAIMLELDESTRVRLGLPACDAVNGGTALCLGREDKVLDGTVPWPSAPRNWDELAAAELWPMRWLGRAA